ncbi:MAG TPA: methyltransferase domain-containing protein [Ktedonobacteraceae bacterium]|nr:methyltransferase domain-containing protein [Ktedonobacteraceae bacterium]
MSETSEQILHYTKANRRAWNEIARVRHEIQPPAEFFAQGHSTLDPHELQAAGDVKGRRLLHLQCSTGEDTLSWSVAGADATGVDISEEQIKLAQQKAAAAGLSTRFVAADVYALPPDLQASDFDYVYTSNGVMVWLPDLTRWAQVIAAALKPGGTFLLSEEHPVASCLYIVDGHLQLESDYFGRDRPELSSGWRHFQGGEEARETKAQFSWPLGDIITALAQADLRIERLEEFPAQQNWRFKQDNDELRRLPGSFLLVARKDR